MWNRALGNTEWSESLRESVTVKRKTCKVDAAIVTRNCVIHNSHLVT